ncbi:unnamed protein product [Meloidogyne enterolobii]|uniref:Uncharacterized protein n=1 Tax=Meloidogyne enterolobii TaxID=390850 RepID=A0ACB0ZHT7_MELEN
MRDYEEFKISRNKVGYQSTNENIIDSCSNNRHNKNICSNDGNCSFINIKE